MCFISLCIVASYIHRPHSLVALWLALMIIISVLWHIQTSLLGFKTNITIILYPFVLLLAALNALNNKWPTKINYTQSITLWTMVFFFVILIIIKTQNIVSIPQYESIFVNYSFRTLTASILAFILASTTVSVAINFFSKVCWKIIQVYIISIVVAQVIDSIVFFSVMWLDRSYIRSWIVIKILLWVVISPLMLLAKGDCTK